MSNVRIQVSPIYASSRDYPMNVLRQIKSDVKDYLQGDGADLIVRDLEATTQGWSNPPDFPAKYTETSTDMIETMTPEGTDADKWKWANDGTKRRTITAKTPMGMIFPRNYSPKTTPAGRVGGPGTRSGPVVRAMAVQHSIAPREFTVKIKTKREKKVYNDLVRVIRNVRV